MNMEYIKATLRQNERTDEMTKKCESMTECDKAPEYRVIFGDIGVVDLCIGVVDLCARHAADHIRALGAEEAYELNNLSVAVNVIDRFRRD